jgi:hypothetical protein
VLAEELKLAGLVHPQRFFQEATPEQPREHPHRQEEPRPASDPALAIGCKSAARNDAVNVRMVRQRRAPGVQHQRGADAGTKVLGIGGDPDQRLGRHVEQQAVDHGLVLVRDVGDRRRQREHHVVILHRQQIGLARVEPALGRAALALRAMPVASGVVGDLVPAAALAAQQVSTQRRTAALFDGRHHLELAQAQVAALGLAPGGSELAEDVGNLQGCPPHDGELRGGQDVQRADHLAQHGGGHMGIDRSRLQPMDLKTYSREAFARPARRAKADHRRGAGPRRVGKRSRWTEPPAQAVGCYGY